MGGEYKSLVAQWSESRKANYHENKYKEKYLEWLKANDRPNDFLWHSIYECETKPFSWDKWYAQQAKLEDQEASVYAQFQIWCLARNIQPNEENYILFSESSSS